MMLTVRRLIEALDRDPVWTWPGVERWESSWGMGTWNPDPRTQFGDVILKCRPPRRAVRAFVKDMEARYRGRHPDIHAGPLDSPLVVEWALNEGYEIVERSMLLVHPLKGIVPDAGNTAQLATRYEDWVGFHQLEETVFGWPKQSPEVIYHEVRESSHPERTALYVVIRDGAVASAGGMTVHGDHAMLWGGQTHPEWRHRGLYRQVVAARLNHAQRLGLEWVAVSAKEDTSFPLLLRMGFHAVGLTRVLRRPSGDENKN